MLRRLHHAVRAQVADDLASADVGEASLRVQVVAAEPEILQSHVRPQVVHHRIVLFRRGQVRQVELLAQAIVLRPEPVELGNGESRGITIVSLNP